MYINRMYTYRLSSDNTAISVASIVMFRKIILFRTSHFGIKPVIGGSPPSDRTAIESSSMVAGEVGHVVPISLIVVDDEILIVRKIGIVVIM